ncbi:hypothetical protein [Piscinibacter gummiphilus]|uniref:Uncharacterized protein n=1 Tax=Piscinibacter gummiphilus TaxID=946333 RepID=A0A1W6L2M4_9BURK|nr:hypothetical protein [Piscinibacter gummiphilus]ARN18436.1 hypothetical protein A4W93_00050 [Piscinibacter gummiphilus]ATU63065.1 hypothetical protein CPZ87_00055 [Piscinibacter gummiphilus]GLS98271.1 hypothetical protein GCM10007918_55630 [Piscinibacter gummiphilus]
MKKIDTGVRKVTPTFGRAAVITHVDKGGGTLVFENNAERLVARLLGLDPRVRHFRRQPFAVDLVERRLLRTAEERNIARQRYAGRPGPSLYTPDFSVEHGNCRLITIEVKLKGFPGQNADHERMTQAAEVLKHYGHEFLRVYIPDDLSHPLHANTGLMYLASMRKDVRPTTDVVDRVERLADDGARTVADYVTGLGISVDYLPSLLVHGVLSMDVITHRIEGRSPVTPAYGSLQHLELVDRLSA